MECPKCGLENYDGVNFCQGCGNNLNEWFCGNCGYKNFKHPRCVNCGAMNLSAYNKKSKSKIDPQKYVVKATVEILGLVLLIISVFRMNTLSEDIEIYRENNFFGMYDTKIEDLNSEAGVWGALAFVSFVMMIVGLCLPSKKKTMAVPKKWASHYQPQNSNQWQDSNQPQNPNQMQNSNQWQPKNQQQNPIQWQNPNQQQSPDQQSNPNQWQSPNQWQNPNQQQNPNQWQNPDQ